MKTVKIFISHSWKYGNQRDKLVNLLDERKYFDWKDDFSKPILAVAPWASEKTSDYVKGKASKIVKWNTESIVEAIRDLT